MGRHLCGSPKNSFALAAVSSGISLVLLATFSIVCFPLPRIVARPVATHLSSIACIVSRNAAALSQALQASASAVGSAASVGTAGSGASADSAQAAVVKNVPHYVNMEAPQEFNALVLDSWDSCWSSLTWPEPWTTVTSGGRRP